MNAISLSAAMLVMGTTFVIVQILAVREFLVVFQGNELSAGIVLGTWLLLEALGSYLGGRWADRCTRPARALISIQTATALLLPVTVVLIRMSRDLVGVPPWETIGPLRVWVASLCILSPLGTLLGAEFSFGCKACSTLLKDSSRAAGRVYLLEAAGAVFGGVGVTFLLVPRLHALAISLVAGSVNVLSAVFLTMRPYRRASGHSTDEVPGQVAVGGTEKTMPWQKILCVTLLFVLVLASLTPASDQINLWSSRMRWKGLDLKQSADSVYGNVSVFQMGEQLSFFLNGIPAITAPIPDIASVEELVHLSLLFHERPDTVLFLGGGVGGGIAEALKHPIRDLWYTELDPLVIETARKFSTDLTDHELSDPRTHVHHADGRVFLLTTNRTFDAVLVNLPEATTLQINRYFTVEFFRLIQRQLKPGGLAALSLPGSTSYLSEESALVNRCVLDTLGLVFPHIRIIPGERNLVLASVDIPLETTSPDTLAGRLTRLGIETAAMSPRHITLKLDRANETWLSETLSTSRGVRINRDIAPSLLYYFLAYKNAQLHNRSRSVVLALNKISVVEMLLSFLVMNAYIVVFLARKKSRSAAVSFSVFTTGFIGMTMDILLILLFQTFYGYVYHWVGMLVAAFMAGLATGAFVIQKKGESLGKTFSILIVFELLIIVSLSLLAGALFVASLLPIHGTMASATLKFIFMFVGSISGFLVGAEFPLAAAQGSKPSTARAFVAGRLYALDLAGACAGTLLVSVLLVPLLGIPQTLFFAVLFKCASLFSLLLARRSA